MKEFYQQVVSLMCVAAITACSQAGVAFKFYVVIKPEETERFISAVKQTANQNGMHAATSRVVSDAGKVLNIVEGRGRGVRLWVENAKLSGKENPELCGSNPEPYPDPAQFMIFTEPRIFGSQAAAKELGGRLLSQFQKLGFDVRLAPAVCGAAALHDRT